MTSKPPNNLLSLDIARVTGVAWGALTDKIPRTAVWDLPVFHRDDALGYRIMSLENTLADFIAWAGIDTVVIAERFPPRTAKQQASGFGLDGAVRAECVRRGVRLMWQPENQVRKEMFGRSGTSEEMKTAAVRWCARHSIKAERHDSAEAAVLWCWTRNQLMRSTPPCRRAPTTIGEST